MKIEYISSSASFTRSLGRQFSRYLTGGDVLLLSGELGGGKTTFISGIAEGLGIMGDLSSPTFTILNEYQIAKKGKFVHADFYRIENIGETEAVGLDDYLYGQNVIVCVEWGDKIKKDLRIDFLEVRFEYLLDLNKSDSGDDEGNQRKITFSSNNEYWDRKLKNLKSKKFLI